MHLWEKWQQFKEITLENNMLVWKEYEQELLKKSSSGTLSADKNNACQNVTENDAIETLCSMKAGKAGGPSDITSNLLTKWRRKCKKIKGCCKRFV